jgi:site-specific DNA recombinase
VDPSSRPGLNVARWSGFGWPPSWTRPVSVRYTNRDGIVRVRDEVSGIKAVLAAGEVRKLRRRINDRLDVIAAEGRPAGSRPFGYAHGLDADDGKTYVIVAEQAEVIRWAADRVLDGWSLANIAAELRGRGLRAGTVARSAPMPCAAWSPTRP